MPVHITCLPVNINEIVWGPLKELQVSHLLVCLLYTVIVIIVYMFIVLTSRWRGDWRLETLWGRKSAQCRSDPEICTLCLPQGRTLSWARSVVVPRSQSCAPRDANRRDLDQRVQLTDWENDKAIKFIQTPLTPLHMYIDLSIPSELTGPLPQRSLAR